MSRRLFLDTNILLDILLGRPGFQAGTEILQLGADGSVSLCSSYLSIANIAYVIRKDFKGGILIPTIKQLSSLLEILPMDDAQLQRALLLDGPDFEDILQAVCAQSGHCQIIITDNPRHFRIQSRLLPDWSPIPVCTPDEFLRM